MRLRSLFLVAAAAVVAGCGDATTPLAPAAVGPSLSVAGRPFGSDTIPGHYIVVYHEGVRDAAAHTAGLFRARRARLRHVFESAVQGFAAELSAAEVAALRRAGAFGPPEGSPQS